MMKSTLGETGIIEERTEIRRGEVPINSFEGLYILTFLSG